MKWEGKVKRVSKHQKIKNVCKVDHPCMHLVTKLKYLLCIFLDLKKSPYKDGVPTSKDPT